MSRFTSWFKRAAKQYVLPAAEQAAKDKLLKLADQHGFAAVVKAATSDVPVWSLSGKSEGFNP